MRRGVVVAVLLVFSIVSAPAMAQRPDTLRLGLPDAVRLAAERNASVELSRLAADETETSVSEERASLLPHFSVDASHGDRTFNTASFGLDFPTTPGQPPLFDPNGEVLGPVTTVDFRGRVAQTLFDWSAIQRVRGARAELAADRARTNVVREQAAATAASAFVQAMRAHDRLSARSADVALAEDLRVVASELLDAGVGVRLDLTRAEAQLATMRAELLAARAEVARADLALLRALNLPLDTPLLLDSTVAGPPSEPARVDAEVQAAVGRRPEIVEVDRRIESARRDVAEVHAERLPTLSLVAGDGVTGSAYDHLLNTYEWSFRVSVPVFDGLNRRAREQARRAHASALDVRRQELARQIEFDIRDAILRVESAQELVAASRARLDLATAELEQARERFSAGVAGSADVVTASMRLNEARTANVDARAALGAARVTLAIADGSLLQM
jgi:outer membrane protein